MSNKTNTVRSLSLRQNFSWTLLGNIIYAGCQWGILVLLAKLGSAEMVGIFGLALAITAPILMLSNLQLRAVQATDTQKLFQFGDYLCLRFFTSFLAILVVIVIVVVSNLPLKTSLVIMLMCIAKIIESISDVIFGQMQKDEIMHHIAISKILKGILSLLTMGIVVLLTKSVVSGTLALAIVWLMILLFYDIKIVKGIVKFKLIINLLNIKNLVKISLPLGIVVMLGSLNINLPRYFLEYYTDKETLGYFTAMAYLIIAGTTIISALGQSATPRLARYYALENSKNFGSLILKLVGIALIIGGLGTGISIMFGAELLTLFYGEEYAKYSDVLIIVMLAGALNYIESFLGYGMTAARTFKIQPYLGIVWIVVSLVGSMLLVPSYGLMGAAYTLVLSACAQIVLKGVVLLYLIYFQGNINSHEKTFRAQ